jgi:SEL1 protein
LTFVYSSLSEPSSNIEESLDNRGPSDYYDDALRSLHKYNRARRKTKRSGLSGFLIDTAIFLFTVQAPIGRKEVGRINGVRYDNKHLYNAVGNLYIAAEAGYADALYTLADIKFFGNNSHPRNISEAHGLYSRLAESTGNSSAQHMLGFMHSTGFGGAVPQDQAKALLFYTFAAAQGNERSQMALGYRHATGISTPKNCSLAVKNYRRVAQRAIEHLRSGPPGGTPLPKASHRIADDEGGIYGEGASVSSSGFNARNHPTGGTEGAAAFDDVIEWLNVESKKGDKKATLNLGKIHYEGVKSKAPDYPKAKTYFLQVARQLWTASGRKKSDFTANDEKLAARAAGYIGRMYLRGEGVSQDYSLARLWLGRGEEHGDAFAQHHLALMHLNGLGGEKAFKLAASLFTKAADQDYSPSQVRMAILFLDQGDPTTAHDYLQLAARHGNAEALYYIAEMTMAGMSTSLFTPNIQEQSCERATQLFKSVAEKAEGVISSLKEADDAYKSRDYELALIDNMLAAEQGFEVAQTNAAYIMDKLQRRERIESDVLRNVWSYLSKWVPKTFTLPISPYLALIYWTRAAKQMNVDALVKMGDYYLAGITTTSPAAPSSSPSISITASSLWTNMTPDAEKAAACYQAAADTHQSGQALWNLGWMHENGIGPMEQDFHLAKRFYDLALEMSGEAYLPVKLALLKLRVRSWWNEFTRGGINGIQDERSCKTFPPAPNTC